MAGGIPDLVINLLGNGVGFAGSLRAAVGHTQQAAKEMERLWAAQAAAQAAAVAQAAATNARALAQANAAATRAANQMARAQEAAAAQVKAAWMDVSFAITTAALKASSVSIANFSKFDSEMTQTAAKIGKLSPEVRKQMEQVAKDLSVSGKVAFSPTELASGFKLLAGAGMDAASAMKTLETVATAAQAGETTMEIATKGLIGAMSALGDFDIKNPEKLRKTMQQYSDIAVMIDRESQTTTKAVLEALAGDAGTAAKSVGMDIRDLASVLGVYAKKNIEAAEASNMTGRAIRLITKSFSAHKQAWLEAEIDIRNTSGGYKKFYEIVQLLEKKTGHMGFEKRTDFFRSQLGMPALQHKAVFPLIGKSDEMKSFYDQSADSGIAEDMAAQQMQSFKNQMKLVSNQIEVASVDLGELLAPAMTAVGKAIGFLVDLWNSMHKAVKAVIVVVLALAVAYMSLSVFSAFLTVASNALNLSFTKIFWNMVALPFQVIALAKAYTVLAYSMLAAAAVNPFTYMVLAATAAVVVVGALINKMTGFTQSIREVNDELKKSVELQDQFNKLANKRTDNIIKSANKKGGAEEVADLRKGLSDSKKQVEDYVKHVEAAQKRLDKAKGQQPDEVFNPLSFTGRKLMDLVFPGDVAVRKAELDQYKTKLEEARKTAARFQEELNAIAPFDKIKTDTSDFERELKRENELFGKNDNEIKRYNLLKLMVGDVSKATAAQIAMANKELAEVDRLMASLNQKTQSKKVDDLTKSWLMQADTLSMTSREAELYKLKLEGASQGSLLAAQASEMYLTALERKKKIMEDGKKTMDEVRTPEEKMDDRVRELNEQLRFGAISFETYERAVELARKQIFKTHQEMTKFDVATAGSAEAITRIANAKDKLSNRGGGISVNDRTNIQMAGNTLTTNNQLVTSNPKSEELLKLINGTLRAILDKAGGGNLLEAGFS